MRGLTALMALVLAVLGLAAAAAAAPSDPLRDRGQALIAVLAGRAPASANFTPGFLAKVPETQIAAIAGQLRQQLGEPRNIASLKAEGAHQAALEIAYDRGRATMRMVLEPTPPHRIAGLLITDSRLDGDSFDALKAEFGKLSGSAGFAVARLGPGAPAVLASLDPGKPLAIGSAFKLYVLAELVRATKERSRRWDEVVPLTARSLPSGILQDWPTDAPVTLHTLASLMISRSDNTATDRLIDVLGRGRIEAVQALAGHSEPGRNAPFLKTAELFLLKGTGGKALLERWTAGDATARRALLADLVKIDRTRFDYGTFTGPPRAIDTAEWFASPDDLVRVLDWIRVNDAGPARAILAINPGIGFAPGEYRYLGFKGGSEPGVINLSFLVQSKSGQWFAVSGSWNDPKAAVDEARFVALMSRAVALAAR